MLRSGQIVGRYVVESRLGSGGVGVVYLVRHRNLGTPHALKVVITQNEGIRTRVLQEGRVQASLRHRNVVSVTDVFDINGAPALLMEYIDGPSLEEWLEDYGPPLEEAEWIFGGILRGLHTAHELDIVHRDLKPGNVLLSAAEGMTPKIADFGLAKAMAESQPTYVKTQSGVAMGTPRYMSPEQIRDAKSVDRRTDIFALGCILYELACGARPFDGPDILTIFNAIANGTYIPPQEHRPDLPDRVIKAIEGCLAPDREERLPTCSRVHEVLSESSERRSWHSLSEAGSSAGAVRAPPVAHRRPETQPGPGDFTPTALLSPVDVHDSDIVEGSIDTLPGSETWHEPKIAPEEISRSTHSAESLLPQPSTFGKARRPRTWWRYGSLVLAVAALLLLRWAFSEPTSEPSAPLSGEIEQVEKSNVQTVESTSASAVDQDQPSGETPLADPVVEPADAPVVEPVPESKAVDVPAAPIPAPKKEEVRVVPPEPEPVEPPPSEPAKATVSFQGAEMLWLVAGDKSFEAGQVPPGSYALKARFEGGERVSVGRLELQPGEVVALQCFSDFLRCRP